MLYPPARFVQERKWRELGKIGAKVQLSATEEVNCADIEEEMVIDVPTLLHLINTHKLVCVSQLTQQLQVSHSHAPPV